MSLMLCYFWCMQSPPGVTYQLNDWLCTESETLEKDKKLLELIWFNHCAHLRRNVSLQWYFPRPCPGQGHGTCRSLRHCPHGDHHASTRLHHLVCDHGASDVTKTMMKWTTSKARTKDNRWIWDGEAPSTAHISTPGFPSDQLWASGFVAGFRHGFFAQPPFTGLHHTPCHSLPSIWLRVL